MPKAGTVVLAFDFSYGGVNGGGEMTIRADGNEIGRGRIARIISKLPEPTDPLDIGFDGDTPVTRDNPVGKSDVAGRAP